MTTEATAESFGLPEIFNVATYFIDRNVLIGRGTNIAIECGDALITYADVFRNVNRCGNALRRLGVRPEERVLLLMHDGPDFVYSFFGAIKIGAVPVPLNTLWKTADYRYVIQDSRASVLIVSAPLLPAIQSIPQAERASLRHVIVAGSTGGRKAVPN
jgi:acyl-CoA synthetase (AMP-forming)/AMP-acid ligase II